MQVSKYLNATEKEIQGKAFNIFFGFSLGNKYFTPEHIRSYLMWGVEHTKEKLAVLIPDKIHAVNHEVKSEYAPERAMSVALRKGIEMEEVVRGIAKESQIPDSRLDVVHWQDIEDDAYKSTHEAIMSAFEHDPKFHETVVQMVRETPHMQSLELSEEQYTRLARYILDELPVLIGGFTVGEIHYGVLPYPGFANLDYLAIDLQEGTSFPEITAQLHFKEKTRLIELYAE